MGMIKEFKTFIVKGNAIDLAVGIIIGAEPYHASYGYACKMNCGGQYVLAACGFGAGGGAHRYTGCAYEAASYGLPVCGSH